MRSMIGREAVFSVAALLISAILIQTIYATVIRPRAAAILAEPIAPQEQPQPSTPSATAPGATPETAPSAIHEAAPATTSSATPVRNLRSVFVILKDYEQRQAAYELPLHFQELAKRQEDTLNTTVAVAPAAAAA